MTDEVIREHLAQLLDWQDAHGGYEKAVEGIPPEFRGKQHSQLPYSSWQLVEHLRIAQHDILDFCRNTDYQELPWPEGYWPSSIAPESNAQWEESISGFLADRECLKAIAADPELDLTAGIPHGTGQTYLRELLLVADHTTYHVGQLVVVRRLLGIWSGN